MSPSESSAQAIASSYYDSSDTDTFFEMIRGGEDIHIGVYEREDTDIDTASNKTVDLMASKLRDVTEETHLLDLGAGYGGAARRLARDLGCKVTCINLSERQNRRNRTINEQQDLDDKIVVLNGTFEAIPHQKETIDLVWSRDAFLHSSDRPGALTEIARVLKPGGELIFTDPMQADDCPDDLLAPVYDRLQLPSLGSFAFYRRHLADLGFEEVECIDMTGQLRTHYDRVRAELASRRELLAEEIGIDYLSRMLAGLKSWVEVADNGYLAWGMLHFRKK